MKIYFLKDFAFFYAGSVYKVSGGKADGSVELLLDTQAVKEYRGDIGQGRIVKGSTTSLAPITEKEYFNELGIASADNKASYIQAQYAFLTNKEKNGNMFESLIAEGFISTQKPIEDNELIEQKDDKKPKNK